MTDRPIATRELALRMASYVLLVAAEETPTRAPLRVKIVEVLHRRTDWTEAQARTLPHPFPDPAIVAGGHVRITGLPPKNARAGEPWIALIATPAAPNGVFRCDDDWPSLPPDQKAAILAELKAR